MLSAIKRVHLVLNPVDMRKSYDGLLSASRNLGLDPYGGECVVFFSKNRRLLKAIIGDAKGIFLLCCWVSSHLTYFSRLVSHMVKRFPCCKEAGWPTDNHVESSQAALVQPPFCYSSLRYA
jgi:hypothetical protein